MSTEKLPTAEELHVQLMHLEAEATDADRIAASTHAKVANLQADVTDQKQFETDLEALIKKFHEERPGIRKAHEEQEASFHSFEKVIHSQLTARALEAVEKYREELKDAERRLKVATDKQAAEKTELDAATKHKTAAQDALAKAMGYPDSIQASLDTASATGKQIMQAIQNCKPLEAFVDLIQPALDHPTHLPLGDVVGLILPEVKTPQDLRAELIRLRDAYRIKNEDVRNKQQAFDATADHIKELTSKLTALKANPVTHIQSIEKHLHKSAAHEAAVEHDSKEPGHAKRK